MSRLRGPKPYGLTVVRAAWPQRRGSKISCARCEGLSPPRPPIEKDLALLERPKDDFDRIVLTERLVEAGLTLILEAEADTNGPWLRRALLVRNGLMVALLALCPIRLKNFAALEMGRSC